MQEEGMQELYDVLEEYEISGEVLDDIDEIQTMIDDNNYDKQKVIEIESKYSVETMFLMDLEHSQKTNNVGFEDNYEDSDLQVLLNLRNRLYLIAVYKVLKEEGKEITKEIIDWSYEDLANILKEDIITETFNELYELIF